MEIEIHRNLSHPNVLAFLGEGRDRLFLYLYLEYAEGGSLLQHLDYDGMPEHRAKFFFVQLIAGVKYLHSKGVMHRDLKLENLLVVDGDVLKIADFGLAEDFKGKEELNRVCGTRPYVAPEVLRGQYKPEPADVWSCGIVLVGLLTAKLPWKSPDLRIPEFACWLYSTSRARTYVPWNALSSASFEFVRLLLVP